MKHISILIVGFAAAFAIAPALAEDLTAGKTAAQLFRSDCVACHRSPSGLVKNRGDVSSLASFLREHYTTKSDTAAALAAYVSGFAPSSASARNRNTAQPTRDRPRIRSEGDGPAADDGDVPRPPRGVATTASRSTAASKSNAPKRRTGTDDAPTAARVNAEEPAAARANADAPPAAPASEAPRAPSQAAPEASPQGERQ